MTAGPTSQRPLTSVMHDYRRASSYFLRRWRQLAGLVLLGLATSGLAVLQPWPLQFLVDTVLSPGEAPSWFASLQLGTTDAADDAAILIIIAAVGSFLIYALTNLLEVALNYGWLKCGQTMVYEMAADLYAKMQQRSLARRSEHPLGDCLNRLFGDSWSLYTIAYALLTVPLQHLVTVLAIGMVAWRIDHLLAVIALGLVPVATALSYLLAQRLRRLARDEAQITSKLMSFVQQTLSAIPLVQTFSATRYTQSVYEGFAQQAVDVAKRAAFINEMVRTAGSLTLAIATALVLLVGGLRVLSGTITIGILVVFLAYLKTINGSVEACLNAMAKIAAANAGLRRVNEVLEEGPGIADTALSHAYRRSSGQAAGRITFENVSFGYPARNLILRDVVLDIQPGETVALIGPSGGGKSTLASLVPRFSDPTAGRILLDGQDVRHLKLSSLRAQLSLVLQDTFLMPLTVAENIAYDPKHYSREDIVAASVATGAHEFIGLLPQGYDTHLGEHGAALSGGQRQLIAITRALLKNAPVLILDEPTSALDVHSEAKVLQALRTLSRERTTIIIAHRLSTIRSADRILFVENGRIRDLESRSEIDVRTVAGAA